MLKGEGDDARQSDLALAMPQPLKNILPIGAVFGRLTVLRHLQGQHWLFRCACGVEKTYRSEHVLRAKPVLSCGCYKFGGGLLGINYKHGHAHDGATPRKQTKVYKAWSNAKDRCFNENNPQYPGVGGSGITMHPAWVDDFPAFLDEVGEPPEEPGRWVLARADMDADYEPGNMEWISGAEFGRRCAVRAGLCAG